MRILITFILVLLFSNTMHSQVSDLPAEVYQFVNCSSTYQMPNTDDYMDDWESFSKTDHVPYHCSSDFDGNKLIDHGLILYHGKSELKLVVLMSTSSGFNLIEIDSFKVCDAKIDIIIDIEKKGSWESIDETIEVAFDGIYLERVNESLSWSYYWNGDGFEPYYYD